MKYKFIYMTMLIALFACKGFKDEKDQIATQINAHNMPVLFIRIKQAFHLIGVRFVMGL